MEGNARYLIAITPESPVDDEGNKIKALLNEGWYRVHLRHPHISRTDMRNIIESVPMQYHDRLVLHGYFDLSFDFNLGGLHLNSRCPNPPALYNGPISRSCHSIAEVEESTGVSYVTLSPIYDSISKHGYKSAFKPETLKRLDNCATQIIALGGITKERLRELARYNFSGYAMLGGIPWDGSAQQVSAYARDCINTLYDKI